MNSYNIRNGAVKDNVPSYPFWLVNPQKEIHSRERQFNGGQFINLYWLNNLQLLSATWCCKVLSDQKQARLYLWWHNLQRLSALNTTHKKIPLEKPQLNKSEIFSIVAAIILTLKLVINPHLFLAITWFITYTLWNLLIANSNINAEFSTAFETDSKNKNWEIKKESLALIANYSLLATPLTISTTVLHIMGGATAAHVLIPLLVSSGGFIYIIAAIVLMRRCLRARKESTKLGLLNKKIELWEENKADQACEEDIIFLYQKIKEEAPKLLPESVKEKIEKLNIDLDQEKVSTRINQELLEQKKQAKKLECIIAVLLIAGIATACFPLPGLLGTLATLAFVGIAAKPLLEKYQVKSYLKKTTTQATTFFKKQSPPAPRTKKIIQAAICATQFC